MKRNFCGGALLAVSLGLAGGVLPLPEGEAKPAGPAVRVGLVDSLWRNTSEAMAHLMLRPLKALLETQTGISGQLVLGGDALVLAQKLKDDQVQVAVFNGFEFAWARQKHPTLKAILIAAHRNRYLQVKVMVRKSSPATCCADLGGKVAALPAQSREHCRLFFERRCTKQGVAPAQFFSQVTSPNDTEDALDDVVDGKAQMAVVDSVELENYLKAKPGRARHLKMLCESERFPCAAIAYQPGQLDETAVARFRAGLIGARNNARGRQMLQLLRISSFEAVPANYEAHLATIAKLYPPPAPAK